MVTINMNDLESSIVEVLNQVENCGEIFEGVKDQVLAARIMPPKKSMTAAQAFEGMINPALTNTRIGDWLGDSKYEFDQTIIDPWASDAKTD